MSDTASSTSPSAPADVDGEPANWIELVAAILLGLAGILTAYAAYNGALAGGDALKAYTESSRLNNDANSEYIDYAQTYASDQATFLQYQILVERGELDTAAVVKSDIMSLELETALDAWLEVPQGEGPLNPLGMEEYVVPQYDRYVELADAASATFTEAQNIDDQGDNFDLAAVYLAVSLFFAGIAALFKVRRLQMAMLAASFLLLFPGLQAIAKGKGWA